MTYKQIQELKCALTDAILKDGSEEDFFEIAQRLIYDGWGEYSPSELIEEAKYLNVSLPISPE
tara:strand:- start:838 stop:1026 length:189 start_codon:yes stop_codon:yes gene_type:complete